MAERNYHSRWGELDLIAVKSDEAGLANEMYFDDEMQEMKGDATLLQGNSVRFVDVPGTMTIPYNRVVISARNRLTPQYMGFL